jgi:long-subunit acyl-CoA synthetase (AMP-forming)
VILSKAFSVESNELTVSLKLRRDVIEGRYMSKLEALYAGCE